VELVQELSQRGLLVGTIKHTHHHHELDVPGKDSHRHRLAGAQVVGILSPGMQAVFLPTRRDATAEENHYTHFAPLFDRCQLVLVEGDSHTSAPKIEVWRGNLGTPPLAAGDPLIMAVVSDDVPPSMAARVLPRSDVSRLADWLCERF
jgi:molybdopterin-guanine dinucleotide biosynthesis protein MobB